jgi:hypothetical protein
MKWNRMAITAVLGLATIGAPLASARDRCDRDYGRYQSSYSRYDNRSYGAGYSSYGSSAYRDSGYRSSGYQNYGYRTNDYNRYPEYRGRRSGGESAAIIGGSAAAGAVVGAIAGGGKGAAIGAVAGGIGGVVIDQATKPQNNYRNNYGRRW